MFAWCLLLMFLSFCDGSHFRGGTISWRPTGRRHEVQFSFKLGWTYGHGPGCTLAKIGTLVTGMNSSYWKCANGCNSVQNINNVNYFCTSASQLQDWEQGEQRFTHMFTGEGPYNISFSGCCWISASYGSSNGWNIQTVVNIGQRSDTLKPNTSPITTGKPVYSRQYGCASTIAIPMLDEDGDSVRCRWSKGSECRSVCQALPNAHIDKNSCTITFPANHAVNGTYIIAITIEDFPKSTITMGSKTYTPSDPLSTVSFQFLVKTKPLSIGCKDGIPVFVTPTPADGAVITLTVSNPVEIIFSAESRFSIDKIDLTTPAGMTYTPLQNDGSRPNVKFVKVSWTPTMTQIGTHIVCGFAENSIGKTSNPTCLHVVVKDRDECESNPCQHGGTCQDFPNRFTCMCPDGFTGTFCETDIDECAGAPCQNGGTCHDGINFFTCTCEAGYTDKVCGTDIDECESRPCFNNGTCSDLINNYTCSCAAGFTDRQCQTDIDECASEPCQHNGTCTDYVNQYSCACAPGYNGTECEIDIDECLSSPCYYGTCIDLVNDFHCICQGGYVGGLCQFEVDECLPGPCTWFYDCHDKIDGYTCTLNVLKLSLVICSCVIVLAGIVYFIIRRKGSETQIEHSRLFEDVILHSPDKQAKKIFSVGGFQHSKISPFNDFTT